jgi:pilus assembly protein CpaB
MRAVTIASLGGSAVLGVAALLVARTALPGPAEAQMPRGPLAAPGAVPVVVAAKAIGFGERLEAGKLTIVRLPADTVPAGAFSTIDAALAQDHGGAPVALTPMAARETLLPAKLSGPGARASVAAEIAPGQRAYAIKVSDVAGVGGHALPGDRVDVVLMRNVASVDSVVRNLVSEVVLQNVRVLGVDLNADPTSNKPAAPTTATLEVSVKDAQKLAVAGELGTLSLALRGSGAAEIEATAPMQTRDFVTGPARAAVTRTFAPRRAAAPRQSGMIIVEGEGSTPAAPKPAA